ncbi:MAG TPA: YdeI/OmpD-associated family protein [Mesorhizobium sp.]|jgi:hypothetical protein|uniref:YdeI/OmpD-associated family protein n=1 Tax=Mesorhizobium sp. TaxID=1871066 RepID=UPI002DDC97BD|nr:YdeI/OmpD-associated family protein [Mesorhizobium sp.]HEV2505477.1 YdeI/OmpD-associated family protein [Mesorhizobium sp.]
MAAKTFRTTIFRDGSTCFIPLDFDPKPVFGKVRAPVKVTLNGYTYRSTIASMGGQICLPLRKSNREAAGLDGGETLDVTLELDSDQRTVEIPPDLDGALTPAGRKGWEALSFTHRREHAEAVTGAKRADTRKRRIEEISNRLNSSQQSSSKSGKNA